MKLKKMLSTVVLVLSCTLLSLPAFAGDILDVDGVSYIGNGITTTHEDHDIDVIYNDVCSGLPYHDMKSNGWATVYIGVYPDTSNLAFRGAQWQCRNCYLVVATTGDDIPNGEPIGTYAEVATSSPIQAFANMWVSRTYYSSSSKLNGYRFTYN